MPIACPQLDLFLHEFYDTLALCYCQPLLWMPAVREPVVREADDVKEVLALIADLEGVWQSQSEALFDIHVTDTDAQLKSTYCGCCACFGRKEKEAFTSSGDTQCILIFLCGHGHGK